MSEAERGRAATEFWSTGDGPEVNEVVDMEDDVFENNGGADLQMIQMTFKMKNRIRTRQHLR